MSTDAVTLWFALLALAAQAAVVVLGAAAAGARLAPGRVGALDRLRAGVGGQAYELALVVATVATLGSLYLSEVAHFEPCRLCWYQRAAMYPLVPLLALAIWRRWHGARWVAVASAGLGAAVSSFHIAVENFPSLESGACDPTNPCSLVWVRHFGYLTIPTMALSGFLLVIALMLTARPDLATEEAP